MSACRALQPNAEIDLAAYLMHLMFCRAVLFTGKVQALVQMADASTATVALTVRYDVQPPCMHLRVRSGKQ